MLLMNRPIMTLSQKVGKQLTAKQWQLATVESCTGGGLAYALTQIAGSSAWICGGWVTYSNAAKHNWLGVTDALLNQHGAVSAEVAGAMAEGALQRSQADVAISVTGIAGPGGGSPEKPVGTVWFGIAKINETTQAHLRQLTGSRMAIRRQAIVEGLQLLINVT